jgi:hypothetical protein
VRTVSIGRAIALTMETECTSEKIVNFYQTAQRNIPKDIFKIKVHQQVKKFPIFYGIGAEEWTS